jgi:FkbM family methyltransferase
MIIREYPEAVRCDMRIRKKRAVGRILKAMSDPVNVRSFSNMAVCLKGWAEARLGRQAQSRVVRLDLKRLALVVDAARAELLSYMEIWHERCYDAVALDAPGCVVDVGANIGAFSLYQAIVKHAGVVIAFEPSPDVFPRLAKNVEINRLTNVRLVNAAVGETTGVLSFSEGRMSVNCQVSNAGPLKVRCVTLDSELSNIPNIDLLKIDTEGYETHVLQGAHETLKRTSRIALELHYLGEDQEIESILAPLGFVLKNRRGNLMFYSRGE